MTKMIPLVCPNCGAKLDVKDGTQTCFCTYCGTKILISDDSNKTYTKNVNINQTSYDRTEIEKIKLVHDLKIQDEKRETKQTLTLMICIAIIGIVAFIYLKLFC